MEDSEIYGIVRVFLNDTNRNFTIWSDEALKPFVDEAKKRVPYFAAALVGISVGALEPADRMLALAGGTVAIRSTPSGDQQQTASDKDSGNRDGSDGRV